MDNSLVSCFFLTHIGIHTLPVNIRKTNVHSAGANNMVKVIF